MTEGMKDAMQKKTGILIVAAGVLLLIFTLNPMKLFSDIRFGFSFETREIDDQQSFEAGDFRRLDIRTGSSDIRVVPGSSDQVHVRLQGKVSERIANQVKLKTGTNGDTLELGVDEPDGIDVGIRITKLELTVELPDQSWDSVETVSGSGNIDIGWVHGDSVTIRAGSGNIDVRQAMGGELMVKTGSGQIEAQDMEAESLIRLESGSGDITAERYKAEILEFKDGSGDIELKDGESAVKGESGSGQIRLETDQLNQDTDLKSGSGNVTVDVDREPSSLYVNFQGGSGSGKVKWDGIQYEAKDEDRGRLIGTFGSGDVKLNVRTGSGNFTLE